MKHLPIIVCCLLVMAVSCKNDAGKRLVGDWQGKALANANLDSFFIRSQRLIDTLGSHNTPDQNKAIYGTYNMDSVKSVLQVQHDSAFLMQQERVKATRFTFLDNGIAHVTFNGGATVDTAKWNFDDAGMLLLEDVSVGGHGALKRMRIEGITDTVLQLTIWNEGDSSKLTLARRTE